jgi:hypothetical protein
MRDPLDDLDRDLTAGLKRLWGRPQRLLNALSARLQAAWAWAITLIIGGRP